MRGIDKLERFSVAQHQRRVMKQQAKAKGWTPVRFNVAKGKIILYCIGPKGEPHQITEPIARD